MPHVRKFDHEEAVRRHAAGESYSQLAREYGVTPPAVEQAVKRATDPTRRKRDNAYNRDWQRRAYKDGGSCIDCGAAIWKSRGSGAPRLRCRACNAVKAAVSVRLRTLRCSECQEWKPDEAFPHGRNHKLRRLRHSVCRGCQAVARQRSRDRRKVPCVRCGKPRLNRLDVNPRSSRDTGLCGECYQAEIRRVGGVSNAGNVAA